MQPVAEEKVPRFVGLCSDTTFKYFLKNEDTRNWIFEIIKRKSGIDLNDYKIIDNESSTGNRIKDYRMDLVFEKGNTVIIVEMENSDKESETIKNYQYLYRTEARRFTSGKNYTQIRTVLILFNNFRNSKSKNLLDAHYTLNDPNNHVFREDIESYEIYLPNYEKTCYDKYEEIERRLVLFNLESYREMEQITKDPFDLKIIKELRNLGMDEIFLTEYEKERVQEKLVNSAFLEGKEEGISQGEKNKQIEIAKKLLKMDIILEQVMEATDLSREEIEELSI